MAIQSEVGNGEEFQREGQLDESEYHLHRVHPRARLRGFLHPAWEHREEGERQSQRQGEAEHADGRCHPVVARGCLDEKQTDNRCCAGEADEREGEGHKENRQQTGRGRGLRVDLVAPRRRQGELEHPKETQGEDNKKEEEENIEWCVCRHLVERLWTKECRDDKRQGHIYNNDGYSVDDGVTHALSFFARPVEKEAHRHRDDWPDTWCEECDDTTEESHEEYVPQRFALGVGLIGLHLVDDWSPELVADGGCRRVGGLYLGRCCC